MKANKVVMFAAAMVVAAGAMLGGCSYESEDEVFATGGAATTIVDENSGFPVVEMDATLDGNLGRVEVARVGGRIRTFVPGRTRDIVYVIDPSVPQVVSSFTVGPGANFENPNDVLVISDTKAYVSRNGPYGGKASDDVLIVNPASGAKLGSIPMSPYATNDDTIARPADMILVGDTAYVALQNLDAFQNVGSDTMENGVIAVINTNTDQVVKTITLSRGNPQKLLYSARMNAVLVACGGIFLNSSFLPVPATSGLQVISLANPHLLDLVISGDDPDVAANIYDVAVDGAGSAYILATGGYGADKAMKLDLNSRSIVAGWRYPAAATGNDILPALVTAPGGFLVIGDWGNSELVFIDMVSESVVGAAGMSLPPVSLGVIE